MTGARLVLVGLAAALAAAGPLSVRSASADDPPATASDDPETPVRIVLDRGPQSTDVKAVRTWAKARADEGRARRGTTFGGDLLAGAGAALARSTDDRGAALALYVEATDAYRPGDSGIGLAWFELATLRVDLGDAAGALEALDEGDRIARLPDVPDDSRWSQSRRDALRRRSRTTGPPLRAKAWISLGRFADAAGLYETLALEPPPGWAADALLQEAAAAAYRAGDVGRALRDIDRSIATATSDADVVERTQWRLLAVHGLLDAQAGVSLSTRWPGDAFVSDAEAAMRRVAGRRGAYRLAIQAASYAVYASRSKEAAELFDLAFADPTFAEEVPKDDHLVRMLMTAANSMLRAGRPEDALKRFQQAEAAHGAPIAGMEQLRIEIEEAIAGVKTRTGGDRPIPDTAREEKAPLVDPRKPRPGLSGAPPRPDPDAAPDVEGAPSSSWVLAAGGAAVLAAAGLVLARARRRRP